MLRVHPCPGQASVDILSSTESRGMERQAEEEGGESINQCDDFDRVTELDTGVGPREKWSRHIMLLPSETLLVLMKTLLPLLCSS